MNWRRLVQNPKSFTGLALLTAFFLVALFAPVLAPYAPRATSFVPFEPPSAQHLLGTTALGEDIFSQLLWGTRLSLLVGLVAGAVATLISVVIGLVAGYAGGLLDDVLSTLTNIFLVIPGLPLLILIAAYIPFSGVWPIIFVIALTGWAWGARVLRAQMLTLRSRDFVQAARVAGEGGARIVFAEILPNMLSLIAANFFGAALFAVLSEAGLEFLGLGDVGIVTWGTMLYWAQTNQAFLLGAWAWMVAPGLCIALLGTSFALLNFAVDEITNPKLRARAPVKRTPRRAAPERLPQRPLTDLPEPNALLSVRDFSVGYVLGDETVEAVRGVDLHVNRGEFLGIAGESGCGKSTLAFGVAQLLQPPGEVLGGQVWLGQEDLARISPDALQQTRWRDFSVVFQASMNVLNPVMRVREQIYDTLQAHGVTDKVVQARRAKELFNLIDIEPRYLDAYPHQLSGGMKQRVVIAIALALEPDLILMDEPTTALDVVVQRTLLQEIDRVRKALGVAVVFITHDLSLLVEISDRVAIMYAGRMVEEAPSRALYAEPLHPYTQGLMRAFPPLMGERARRSGIPGKPPDLRAPPPGCPFFARCPARLENLCERVTPPLQTLRLESSQEHRVACHLYDEALLAAHGRLDALVTPGEAVA
jgi:peptide/nickel transport system permease protein